MITIRFLSEMFRVLGLNSSVLYEADVRFSILNACQSVVGSWAAILDWQSGRSANILQNNFIVLSKQQ